MGTPLRLLLSPKLLSPASPILGKCLTTPKRYIAGRHGNIGRKLDFTVSPFKFRDDIPKSKIHVTVTDFDKCEKDTNKNVLLINTPQKVHILKNGLERNDNLNVLGKGSFGTVIRGCYENQNVAVKVIKLDKSAQLRESNVLNFDHKNIVRIVDMVTNANQNYAIVIMEYLGYSRHLQDVMDDASVSFGGHKIKKIALDICHGLAYCHENGILHLDVKPKNILVCSDSVCKLCDFGNCYKIGDETDYVHQGTVVYTDPEILLGRTPTVKSDVYSFGIVLWQLIFREAPYQSVDHQDIVIYKVVKNGLRPKSTDGDCEDRFQLIYTKCWSANPEDRPDTYTVINCLARF